MRLLKASLLGPEFFRVYILNKKAAGNDAQFPDNLERYQQRVDPTATKVVVANAVNPALYGKNALVDELYVSTTPGNKVLELKAAADNNKVLQKFVVGTDCVSIQALKKSELQTVQLYDMAKRVAAATAPTVGVGKDAADSQGAVTFFRIQKYGITNLSGSGEDQIYKTIRGIAEHYGRYHYSPKTIRKGDWENMTLSTEGQGTWYNVEVDVKDTVLAPLYAALDPQATVAKDPMPNDCVEGKDGESTQVNCDGKAFKNKNTANPRLDEFIQSVERNTITDKTEGDAPTFNVSVNENGEIESIDILSIGDDLADGTHSLKLNGGSGASGAEAKITIENGKVVEGSMDLISGGSGYDQAKTTADFGGKKGATITKGVFNQTISKRDINGNPVEVSSDSITSANLGIRNKCLTDDCKGDEIADQKGIIVMDLGPQALIPESISKRVKRHVDALSVVDTNGNINLVQYHWEAGYQIIQMATPEQLTAIADTNEAAKLSIKENKPGDELDYIVDQVSIPGLDFSGSSEAGQALEAFTKSPGGYYEAKCLVPPGSTNVMRTDLKFLSPQPGNIGAPDADCKSANDPEALAKHQKTIDKLITQNICGYTRQHCWESTAAQSNATIQIVGEGLLDIDLAGGLESLKVVVDTSGPKTTYSIGTRRKQQVMNKLMDQDTWFSTSPSFYNNVFSR